MQLVRRERRRLAQDPVIPLAPLIDVVFLLLIFFMLITRFLNPTIDLSLPESTTAQINDNRSVLVAIDATGQLWLDEEQITWSELTPRLSGLADKGLTVRLRADGGTEHRMVVQAFDCIRTAGLEDIALEAVKEPGN
ncbi:MAG: biopolymer transporter ExbD [Planctomycetales bacterium]|nr:biopolymer transporter ExbD [bacterium]UNM08370.1 MAG: biopolymer transporter ExbD [Planctomycetales bacterium]